MFKNIRKHISMIIVFCLFTTSISAFASTVDSIPKLDIKSMEELHETTNISKTPLERSSEIDLFFNSIHSKYENKYDTLVEKGIKSGINSDIVIENISLFYQEESDAIVIFHKYQQSEITDLAVYKNAFNNALEVSKPVVIYIVASYEVSTEQLEKNLDVLKIQYANKEGSFPVTTYFVDAPSSIKQDPTKSSTQDAAASAVVTEEFYYDIAPTFGSAYKWDFLTSVSSNIFLEMVQTASSVLGIFQPVQFSFLNYIILSYHSKRNMVQGLQEENGISASELSVSERNAYRSGPCSLVSSSILNHLFAVAQGCWRECVPKA